ncbi:MAG: lysine decarboxylase LdcC [Fusobacteria bacterium]|nr:lysine decarboxylase LdcC [Fusobacteriota bacterium]
MKKEFDKLPVFTKALFNFADSKKETFCTPIHDAGSLFDHFDIGKTFKGFLGENIFKCDTSASAVEMGSLLDNSGPYGESTAYLAKILNVDRAFPILNGTSTANKFVADLSVSGGDTVLVDRNCHKSIAHFLMGNDVKPLYFTPARNSYGVLGTIPYTEFEDIDGLMKKYGATKYPTYAVVTNSTYDGIFYNTQRIVDSLKKVKTIHFDEAWVTYASFYDMYIQQSGHRTVPNVDQRIVQTTSVHKLAGAFSMASIATVKGKYNEHLASELFMKYTTTSPFYPMMASIEMSIAMLSEDKKTGSHVFQNTVKNALYLRKELKKEFLKHKAEGKWYFDVWQPENLVENSVWELKPEDTWHGYEDIKAGEAYLDPLKVSILFPNKAEFGIPARVVSKYLELNGIIIEKTNPYTMLILVSASSSKSKIEKLLKTLEKFYKEFEKNLPLKDILPSIFAEDPIFYEGKTIQEVTKMINDIYIERKIEYQTQHSLDVLPEQVYTPYHAFQYFKREEVKTIKLKEIKDEICATILLVYPPGICIYYPGERITSSDSGYLQLRALEEGGKLMPGFDFEIHGSFKDCDGDLCITVISE